MKFETAFANAWGRAPTRAEVARAQRVCDAFEVRDNDALKAIVGLLEFYDSQYRSYPGRCAEAASASVKQWFGSADGEAAFFRALHAAAGSVSALPSPARPIPSPNAVVETAARRELYWVTLGGLATASNAIAGGLGVIVGTGLSGGHPCWVPRDAASSVAATLIGAPLGWVVFLSLLVPAHYGAVWGWRCGRDRNRTAQERWLGWAALATIACFVLGWAGLITRLVLHG